MGSASDPTPKKLYYFVYSPTAATAIMEKKIKLSENINL
jgi:hypothetical protein